MPDDAERFVRLRTLAARALAIVTEARIGGGDPGYYLAVPPPVQAYEAGRRPPPTLTPTQVAKRFAEARVILGEAKRVLPLIKSPQLRQAAFPILAYGFATAHGLADARRMNAAITRPADRLYSLCVIADGWREVGNKSEATRAARQAKAIAATLPKTASRAVEHRLIFKVCLETGDLLTAYTVVPLMHEPYDRADSLAMLATVLARAGGKPEAKRLIGEAWKELPNIRDSVAKDTAHEYLVYALVALPDLADAKRTVARIYDPTRRQRAETVIREASLLRQKPGSH